MKNTKQILRQLLKSDSIRLNEEEQSFLIQAIRNKYPTKPFFTTAKVYTEFFDFNYEYKVV